MSRLCFRSAFRRLPISFAAVALGSLAAAATAPSCTDLVELSPFPCGQDFTCPVELTCNAGQCMKSCFAVTDCPEEWLCSVGFCVATCETDDDCHEGSLCSGGACLPDFTSTTCGNFTCEVGETCESCFSDCPTCAVCENFSCEPGEDCTNCATDCGACQACGDAFCDTAVFEDCTNCPNDCGACPASCGDAFCDSANFEDCTNCPNDCGACQGECTLFAGQCPGDQTCIVTGSVTNGSTACDLVGFKQLGEPCFLEECGYDAVCWGIDPNFVCTQECDNFHGCAAGFCQPVTNLPNGGGVCQF